MSAYRKFRDTLKSAARTPAPPKPPKASKVDQAGAELLGGLGALGEAGPKIRISAPSLLAAEPAIPIWGDAEAERAAIIQHDTGLPRATFGEPLLLKDGRRLHRFRADTIPMSASHQARALSDQANCYGAVLVADGHDLIVVERWRNPLPVEALRTLKDAAGAIIAHLRGESRARCTPQERGLHNE